MKTTGIATDNYKLNKFKKELTKKGFTDFEIEPLINETSLISLKIQDHQLGEIKKICEKVEFYFKNRN